MSISGHWIRIASSSFNSVIARESRIRREFRRHFNGAPVGQIWNAKMKYGAP